MWPRSLDLMGNSWQLGFLNHRWCPCGRGLLAARGSLTTRTLLAAHGRLYRCVEVPMGPTRPIQMITTHGVAS
ncbi:hypothetical protein BHM03_00052728, partial [Ensete ventricosum]